MKYSFICDHCELDFEIESDKKSVFNIKPVKCPKCDREWGISKRVRYNWGYLKTICTATGGKHSKKHYRFEDR